jgi:hypothetical protein
MKKIIVMWIKKRFVEQVLPNPKIDTYWVWRDERSCHKCIERIFHQEEKRMNTKEKSKVAPQKRRRMMWSIWKFNELDDNNVEVGKEGKKLDQMVELWDPNSSWNPWRDEEMNNCRIGHNDSLLCINFQILHCKNMFSICLFEM